MDTKITSFWSVLLTDTVVPQSVNGGAPYY